jgi:acetyl esterase/lipase
VFLHGGGWRLGSRRSAGPAFAGASPSPFERFARAGLAVASVEYRLSGEALWPARLHDAKAAVRWLRTRSAELAVDAGRIAAWGESAGGHLAALLGLVTVSDAFVYLLLQHRLDISPVYFPLLSLGTAGPYMLLAAPLGLLALVAWLLARTARRRREDALLSSP